MHHDSNIRFNLKKTILIPQRITIEFDHNEKKLEDLRELIAQYTEKGKTEASNRLNDQLNLLEKRFDHCQFKLNKCTAPQAAYESKIKRAVAELRNVETSTLVLDIASAGPSAVQNQYQHCLVSFKFISSARKSQNDSF